MAVRSLTADDVGPLGDVLARAFDDDPIFRGILPADEHRRRALPILFREWIRRLHLEHEGASFTTDDYGGAALWSPPSRWHIGVLEQAVMAPAMIDALRGRTLIALRTLLAIESMHPREPHWYLRVIGCDPSRQGRGVGAALLRPVLERCDAERIGAYLESSNEKNLTFYRRHGFEMARELTTPVGAKAFLMWRKPAPR